MKWQPIETAPKNETHFIAFTTLGRMIIGYYKWSLYRNHGNGGWKFVAPSPPSKGHQPTHWMPLPSPPEEI